MNWGTVQAGTVTGIQVGTGGSPWVSYVFDEPVILAAGQTLEVLNLGEREISFRVGGQDVVRALHPAGEEGPAGG